MHCASVGHLESFETDLNLIVRSSSFIDVCCPGRRENSAPRDEDVLESFPVQQTRRNGTNSKINFIPFSFQQVIERFFPDFIGNFMINQPAQEIELA
jgi:hypothetical protein